jgi:hypothetical protein
MSLLDDYERLLHDYERLKTEGDKMRVAQREFHDCEKGSSRKIALLRTAKAAEKSYDRLVDELNCPVGLFPEVRGGVPHGPKPR